MIAVGWIAAVALAICMLPQVVLVVRQGHARGISGWFLLLWGVGEVAAIVYTWGDPPLMVNYGCNLAGALCIGRYWMWPRP